MAQRKTEPVPTPTLTPQPPTSSLPSPTPSAIPTLEALPAGVFGRYDSEPSPDGKWVVRHLMHDEKVEVPRDHGNHPYFYHSQHLVATDGSLTRTLRTEWIPDGLGATWPRFLGWAPDSSAAFVYRGGTPDGCSTGGWSEEVWRVAVPDGEVTVLGAVPGDPALSADARWLGGVAKIDEAIAAFEWIDLERGERGRDTFPVPRADDGTPGDIAAPRWSPDGRAIVAVVHHHPCSDSWRQALLYHEIGSREARVIFEQPGDQGLLWISEWLADDTLVVTDRPPWWGEGEVAPSVWRLDARTGRAR